MKSILGQLLNGRYSIIRKFEQKSSHTAYLAEDRLNSNSVQCLIKQFSLKNFKAIDYCSISSELKNTLFREIERVRQFNHYSLIPAIQDYFLWGEELFLVRQFVRGESLAEIISERQLEELELISLLKKTITALDIIHQAGASHLNLKPSNLIVNHEELQVLLTDCDRISYLLQNNLIQYNLNPTKLIEDNYYFPPEQQAGNPQENSDFYAVGVIAIKALTGKYPHEVSFHNLDNYARALLKDNTTGKTFNISSHLAHILQKLIQENTALRYQSTQEILQSLQPSSNIILLPHFDETTPKTETFLIKSPSEKVTKILPLTLFLFLIITLIIPLVYWIPKISKNHQENFERYQNSHHAIALDYPQGWTIKELEDPITGGVILLTSPLENENDAFQEKIYLSIDELKNSQSNYEQTLIEKIINTTNISNIYYKQKSGKLAHQPSHTITYQRQQDNLALQQQETFTVKDGKAYLITYIAERKQYQNFLPIVNQIMKSFTIENFSD